MLASILYSISIKTKIKFTLFNSLVLYSCFAKKKLNTHSELVQIFKNRYKTGQQNTFLYGYL